MRRSWPWTRSGRCRARHAPDDQELAAGKVFVDHSQNAARKTTATPYTLRARSAPTRVRPRHLGRGRVLRGTRPCSRSTPTTSLRVCSDTATSSPPPTPSRDPTRPPPLPSPQVLGFARARGTIPEGLRPFHPARGAAPPGPPQRPERPRLDTPAGLKGAGRDGRAAATAPHAGRAGGCGSGSVRWDLALERRPSRGSHAVLGTARPAPTDPRPKNLQWMRIRRSPGPRGAGNGATNPHPP